MEITRGKLVDYERTASQYRNLCLTSQAVQTEIDVSIADEPTETHPFVGISSALDSFLEQPQESFENLEWDSGTYGEDFPIDDDYTDAEPSHTQLTTSGTQVQRRPFTSLTERYLKQQHGQDEPTETHPFVGIHSA